MIFGLPGNVKDPKGLLTKPSRAFSGTAIPMHFNVQLKGYSITRATLHSCLKELKLKTMF